MRKGMDGRDTHKDGASSKYEHESEKAGHQDDDLLLAQRGALATIVGAGLTVLKVHVTFPITANCTQTHTRKTEPFFT